MERILNKIDDRLREKIKEITKDGKIHSVKENKITTDKENMQNNKNNAKSLKQSYLVQVEKCEKYEVEAFGIEEENKKLGRFLDVKE